MHNIPISRQLLYLMFIGLMPIFFVIFLFISQKTQIEELQQSLALFHEQMLVKEKKQSLNFSVKQNFKNADHFYIDKYLETLVFLEPEIEVLQKIISDTNVIGDERIKKRLEFLTTPSNNLVFSEGVVHTFPFFQETNETLVHPVEVNGTDIQKILSRIEGVKIQQFEPGPHRPQLIITDFKLDKKKVNDKNEVYQLTLSLVKREFL